VITGFNTDIERDGVVYHVQTEDKGLDSPLILSLVYSGGEILAAKRTPYQDLIAEGFTDEALAERLNRQHRLICAAINAGRIEELKQMSSGRQESTRPRKTQTAKPLVEPTAPADLPVEVSEEFVIETSAAGHEDAAEVPIRPAAETEQSRRKPAPVEVHEEFVIETSAARPPETDWKPRVEELIAEPAAPAPPIPSLPTIPDSPPQPLPTQLKSSTSPDSAYTVYDSRRPSRPKKNAKREEELALIIMDDDEFRAGQSVTIRMLLQRHVGEQEKPLGGVQLAIKVLGSTFRPQIYAVKTQRDGVAVISVDLPHFSSGRAAVVIRAEAQGKSVELRRVIHPT